MPGTGAAFAQSTVTVYGKVDLGIVNDNDNGATVHVGNATESGVGNKA